VSTNNDSGGGCMLWFIDFIFGIINNRRIRKYNKEARGVQEHMPVPAEALFPPDSFRDSIVISGGGQGERLHLCKQILMNAHDASHPVIIIHTANGALENIVAGNNLGIVVSNRSKRFDAFASFDFNEIVQLVTDTCKAKYDIKPSARYVLHVAYDLLKNRGKNAFFSSFANCPYFQLNDTIAKRLNKGTIPQDTADKLISLLLTGQIELPKVESFFCDMKSQIEYLSAQDPNRDGAVSVLSAIQKRKTLCIDIRASSNTMFLELIVNSLIMAMNRGFDFSLLIDDIAFTNNELLKNTICQRSNHQNILISKDLFALTGGKEDTFSTVIGEADRTILFAHNSSVSCDKWSKYLGEYDKIDVSYNSNSGWFQSSRWGYSSNSGQTETLNREHKVKPEQIGRLSQNEVFFFNKSEGYIIQTMLV
jgi:hypothetical protein